MVGGSRMFAEKKRKSGVTESVWGLTQFKRTIRDGITVISSHECFNLS